MKAVIFGPPCAGKTTLAKNLSHHFQTPIVSTGQMFRTLAEEGSQRGIQAREEYWGKGKLVPDDITILLLKEALEHGAYHGGYILDGFPRTVAQASGLDNAGWDLPLPIYLHIQEEEILHERAKNRRICSDKNCATPYSITLDKLTGEEPHFCTQEGCDASLYQRRDDQEERIRNTRMKEYKEKTDPIKEFYRDRILTTNANTSRDQVFWNVLDQIRERK